MSRNDFAIIDIGSHSVRMLISRMGKEESVSTITRLGEGFAAGLLADPSMDRTFEAVQQFAEMAGDIPIIAFATSALRDAENRAVFFSRVYERLGLSIALLSGEQEARLAYAGASVGVEATPLGVIDIGGGSTEVVVGGNGEIFSAESYQAGAVRLTGMKISKDEMIAYARNICVYDDRGISPTVWRGIGGTITTLAAMDLRLVPYDPMRVHNYPLSFECVRTWANRLESLSVEERARLPGLQPERAPVILAGVCVLCGVMEAVGTESIAACVSDNLRGAASLLTWKDGVPTLHSSNI